MRMKSLRMKLIPIQVCTYVNYCILIAYLKFYSYLGLPTYDEALNNEQIQIDTGDNSGEDEIKTSIV